MRACVRLLRAGAACGGGWRDRSSSTWRCGGECAGRAHATAYSNRVAMHCAFRGHSSGSSGHNGSNDHDDDDDRSRVDVTLNATHERAVSLTTAHDTAAAVTRASSADARQRTSDALRRLFRDDAARAAAQQRPGNHLHAGSATPTRVVSFAPSIDDDDVDDDDGEAAAATATAAHTANESAAAAATATATAKTVAATPSRAPPHATVELLEQQLLDDNYAYFPLALHGGDDDDAVAAPALQHDKDNDDDDDGDDAVAATARAPRYVPGQQIVPPGMTRYRVDVQYQGCDFDGWHASTTRALYQRYVDADGRVRRVALPATSHRAGTTTTMTSSSSSRNGGAVARDGMSTRYYAKSVLEDALAVALDVASVDVVASVMPEAGVTVRRLCCHVDVPSDIEMQPRTVVQRATLWLQKRQQPLAIVAFTRCRNQDFHARHSGVRRVYCYRICNRVAPPLFDAGLQWHVDRYLDVARMQRFAAAMQGTRDFGYFADPKMSNALRRAAARTATGRTSAAHSDEHDTPVSLGLRAGQLPAAPKLPYEKGLSNLQRAAALPTFNEYGQRVLSYNAKSSQYHRAATNLPTIRTVDKIEVRRQDDEVLLWFVGQSFLRQQIRNMVAVLKASGHGLWDEQELRHAFATGFVTSRRRFAREHLPPAPAHGLTLWDVEYPAAHRDDYVAFVDSGPYEEVDVSATL